MTKTTIEWVRGEDGSDGHNWNALRAQRIVFDGEKLIPVSANHCERVNDACRNCYADSMNRRLRGLPFKPGHRKDYLAFVVDEKKLREPLKLKKPTRIFVESMSDAFGEWWPDEFIDKLYAVMALTPQHTYINLSKRPERRRQYLDDPLRHNAIELAAEKIIRGPEHLGGKHVLPRLPFKNVIEGTSVSNQREADEFVPILLRTSAAVRGLSCEPLLGPIDLERWIRIAWQCSSCREFFAGSHKPSCTSCGQLGGWTGSHAFNSRHGRGLDWIIAGGESGRKARPMHPAWAQSLRDQCAAAGVPFFFKQWGQYFPMDQHLPGVGRVHGCTAVRPGWHKLHVNGSPDHEPDHLFPDGVALRVFADDNLETFSVGKGKAGRLLDGIEHNEFPRIAA